MLNRKVIAKDVANLTDARYFAARGVDYLLFDLELVPIEKIIEIKDWIEGPQLLLLFSENTLPLLDEAIIKLSPSGISASAPKILSEIVHMESHTDIFSLSEEDIVMDQCVFQKIKSITDLGQLEDDHGIVISGGDEDAIGIKAFDELDEILDSLEE